MYTSVLSIIHNTVWIVHCKQYSLSYTLYIIYNVYITLYTLLCELYTLTILCELYTLHHAMCAVHGKHYCVNCTLCTLKCAQYSVQITVCTVHCTQYNKYKLLSELYTVHITRWITNCTHSYTLLWEMHTVPCTHYCLKCTLYTVHITIWNVHRTHYLVKLTLYSEHIKHCIMYSLQF